MSAFTHYHTFPWHNDEFIRVNGLPLVYDFNNEDAQMEVLVPGPRFSYRLTLEQIKLRGWAVTMPQVIRKPVYLFGEAMP